MKFRSEHQLLVDRFNFYANKRSSRKSSTTTTPTTVTDDGGGLMYIEPDNGLKGDHVNFTVKSDGFSNICFLEHYQLQGEISYKVTYNKYSEEACTNDKLLGRDTDAYLNPTKHKFCLPTSTSLLALFKRAEVSFNTHREDLSNLITGDVCWLNKIQALETCMEPRKTKMNELAEFGMIASFNRYVGDLSHLLGDNLAELWPSSDDAGSGSRTHFARIPMFPFRLHPPWVNFRIQQNIGAHMIPNSGGIIPPQTELHLRLEYEKSIPYMHRFTSLTQEHETAGKCGLKDEEKWGSWRKFSMLDPTDLTKTKKIWVVMESIEPELKSLYLVVKKITPRLSPRIESHFSQYFTVYRTTLHRLVNASTQHIYPTWDTPTMPNTMILGFIRDQ